MDDPQEKIRGKQERALADAARGFVNDGDTTSALLLLERATMFLGQNLITIMIIIHDQFRVQSEYLKRASVLFNKHLMLCVRPTDLIGPALWVRNPIRENALPSELKTAIDSRRRSLERGWDGVWRNLGLERSSARAVLMQRPEDVFDPNACLIAAGQVRNWNPWFDRYRVLGGDPEDPKYLKLWVARVSSRQKRPTPKIKAMLRKYAEAAPIGEVRTFLRHITPVKKCREGKDPNRDLAAYALLIYCGLERLEHDLEDWVHIAKSALYLEHITVQRIAQRYLAGLERTPSAQQVFEALIQRNGAIPVTRCPKDDIGLHSNPIWRSVYPLLPVDANARKILITYSRYEANIP
jgi:hypothetical protein